MPFKTRQQKLSAEARRFSFAQDKVSLVMDEKLKDLKSNKGDLFPKKSAADFGYVRGDLIKILVIASVVILVQIVVAFILK